LGLNNKLLKGREGGVEREVVQRKFEKSSKKSSKKVWIEKRSKKSCNYLLGIIYKLLEGSRGDGKEVVRKKIEKKVQKMFKKCLNISMKKVWQKGSNDSIAEYCIIKEVRKKFEKKVWKKVWKIK
jgi:hypothetical protein